jgi:hypothetical protein
MSAVNQGTVVHQQTLLNEDNTKAATLTYRNGSNIPAEWELSQDGDSERNFLTLELYLAIKGIALTRQECGLTPVDTVQASLEFE